MRYPFIDCLQAILVAMDIHRPDLNPQIHHFGMIWSPILKKVPHHQRLENQKHQIISFEIKESPSSHITFHQCMFTTCSWLHCPGSGLVTRKGGLSLCSLMWILCKKWACENVEFRSKMMWSIGKTIDKQLEWNEVGHFEIRQEIDDGISRPVISFLTQGKRCLF